MTHAFKPNKDFVRRLRRNQAELMLARPHRFNESDVRALVGEDGLRAWLDVAEAKARYAGIVQAMFPWDPRSRR